MRPLFSILILSIDSRKEMLATLLSEFERQRKLTGVNCEILVESDGGELSKGTKRNRLLDRATGEYLAFFDDDDWPSDRYIELISSALTKKPDCCSLLGSITIDGGRPELFEHSLRYKVWKTTTNRIKYERCPNHLNMIKSSIAKRIRFPEINHGEDHKWSDELAKSGLLKREARISEVLYNYRYVSKK